jgi:hypothetical protein
MLRWVGVLVMLGTAILAGTSIADRRRALREIDDLRGRIYSARVAADSCQNSVAYEEMSFRRYNTVVDSLRREVRSFEAMDDRGVPEEAYDQYLELFEGYNDSVGSWEERAERLRVDEAACRAIIDGHNALTDSLRRRLLPEPEETG